ncbi:MafI family immunity protein [Paenibacillus farraposensis]|uniref:MafI family immunity protein n=1 Tax=Paenibacillus farraposensis TaxID=2807095 RepID=A0ABW4DFH2_9BACL|nr:MafI family immunity protein [Paenibacillus farraposensis]MCC3379666.1 MafI family immunity protein [Paenibacillus farraposensis]
MDVKRGIEDLLNLVKIPPEDSEKVCEYLEYDEWGVALEHFSATVLDEGIEINELIYSLIKKVGEYMELEEETWESLKPLINN